MPFMRILSRILFLGLLARPAVPDGQETQKEYFDSGKLKSECSLDKEGKRHGRYIEYYESGRKKISGAYDRGLAHGEWWEHYESGPVFGKKSYARGKPAGDVLRMTEKGALLYRATLSRGVPAVYGDLKKPEPAYGRSLEQMRKKIYAIDPPAGRLDLDDNERFDMTPSSKAPYLAGRLKTAYLEDALKHLNVYRYLSGVLPTVKLDENYTEEAQYAAVVVAAHGKLTHTPPRRPDMESGFHTKGYKGASSSNLSQGRGNLRSAVDGLMGDTGDNNLREVGHRAWIQNPAMGKTGFGECGNVVAQWAHDQSGRPDWPDMIGYPARGYHPVEYFVSNAPWSMGPREGKFTLPEEKDLQVRMRLLDDGFDFTEEIAVDHRSIGSATYGFGARAVFRPVLPGGMTWEGKRVWVLILRATAPVYGYFVHFVKLQPEEQKDAESGK